MNPPASPPTSTYLLLFRNTGPENHRHLSADERQRWAERQVRLERAVQVSLTTEQVLAIMKDPAYWEKTAAAG